MQADIQFTELGLRLAAEGAADSIPEAGAMLARALGVCCEVLRPAQWLVTSGRFEWGANLGEADEARTEVLGPRATLEAHQARLASLAATLSEPPGAGEGRPQRALTALHAVGAAWIRVFLPMEPVPTGRLVVEDPEGGGLHAVKTEPAPPLAGWPTCWLWLQAGHRSELMGRVDSADSVRLVVSLGLAHLVDLTDGAEHHKTPCGAAVGAWREAGEAQEKWLRQALSGLGLNLAQG